MKRNMNLFEGLMEGERGFVMNFSYSDTMREKIKAKKEDVTNEAAYTAVEEEVTFPSWVNDNYNKIWKER